jgi:hypothetical protein
MIHSSLNDNQLASNLTLQSIINTLQEKYDNVSLSGTISKTTLFQATQKTITCGISKALHFVASPHIPLTFTRTKKVIAKNHPHYKCLLALHQSGRNYHI